MSEDTAPNDTDHPSTEDGHPLSPSVGLNVLHLFYGVDDNTDAAAIRAAVKRAVDNGDQVIPVAMLGHKGEFALMALSADVWSLRQLQTDMRLAGAELNDSYVSMTEVSEYAPGLPEEMLQNRLYPQLPPEGKTAWCFYPMSKHRNVGANWYRLDYDKRKELMYEHGASGRKFAGRVLQVVTGSTGVDDYEWGVTLFCERPDDLKAVVYTMRYDEASALYGDFGTFYTGAVASLDEVLHAIGLE